MCLWIFGEFDWEFEISDGTSLVIFGEEDFSTCQEKSTKNFGSNFGGNFGEHFGENFGNFVSNVATFFGNLVQQKGGANNLPENGSDPVCTDPVWDFPNPKGPKIEKFQDLEIFKWDWKFQASHPPQPYFCWEFWRSRLKFSIEIEIFKRDWKFQSGMIFFNLWALSKKEHFVQFCSLLRVFVRFCMFP